MDENIGKYCDVLDADDRKYSIAEELNSRLYKLQTMLQAPFNRLYEVPKNKNIRQLIGIHTYDILRNPEYIQKFQYFSADLPGRDDYIVDDDTNEANNNAQSDFVRLLLNLPYFRPHEIDELKKKLACPDLIMGLTGRTEEEQKANQEETQRQIDELDGKFS